MDISLRKEKRRLDCYTFKELYEFFSQFYGLSTSKDGSIGDIRKWSLHNSDIEFRLKSFNDEGLVTEFIAMTWAGGWSHNQKFLHLEWNDYNDKDYLGWYIRDLSVGSSIRIDSNNFLSCIIDFIIKNEADCYDLPLGLKRQLVINKLIDEV